MSDRARFEAFNDHRLIPPGIMDARSRAILGLFAHGASLFDFKKMLMRRADEIPDAALPLAIHERSLGEYIPDHGLPAPVVRDLIDNSFDIHARQGTDGGVAFALAFLGATATIEQWWQATPMLGHDTHRITIQPQPLYDDDPGIGPKTYRALKRTVEATKRKSQGTSWRVPLDLTIRPRVAAASAERIRDRRTVNPIVRMDARPASGVALTLQGQQRLTILPGRLPAPAASVAVSGRLYDRRTPQLEAA